MAAQGDKLEYEHVGHLEDDDWVLGVGSGAVVVDEGGADECDWR